MATDKEIKKLMDEFPIPDFSSEPELDDLSDEDLEKTAEDDSNWCGTHAEEARQILESREIFGGQKGLEEFRREMQDPDFEAFSEKILKDAEIQ